MPTVSTASTTSHSALRLTHLHVALGAKVVHLIRLHAVENGNQVGGVSEVTVVHEEACKVSGDLRAPGWEGKPCLGILTGANIVGVLVHVLNAGRVEGGRNA